jgi:MFS family permease
MVAPNGLFHPLFHPNFPFAPKQFPRFYGWVILLASILGVIMSIPGQTIGVSVFTDHLLRVTDLSRLELSNAYLVGTLTSGCLLPLGGSLLDRFGARLVIVSAALGLSVTLGYFSLSDRTIDFLSQHLPPISTSTIAFGVLVLGFITLRFSGQGMLTMASYTTLGKWFDRRRGMVSGIQGVVLAGSFAMAPWVMSRGIAALGWRSAWQVMALLLILGAGVGWLLLRDNPEECGLWMDGRTPTTTAKVSATNSGEDPTAEPPTLEGYNRGQALKTLAFWAVALALASHALTLTGITFHIVDIGTEFNLTESQIVTIFLPIAGVATGVGYGMGLAADRVRLQLLFMVMLFWQGIGFWALTRFDQALFEALTVIGLGVTTGCFGTLSTVTLPRFFGRAHLGAIAGVQMMVIVMASALGPSFLAWFQQQQNSYKPALYWCAALSFILIGLMALARTPRATPSPTR